MSSLSTKGVPPGTPVTRKQARRLLRQVTIGVGAMLLSAVDDWNALSERHSAHLRTVLRPLGRGTYVAAMTAAGTEVWLGAGGKHPPGHMVCKAGAAWPAVSSRSAMYMEIHHNEALPINDRRTAFCTQDSAAMGLIGDPTHCELTWEYDVMTESYVKHIWVSAPGVDWDRYEVPMGKVQALYSTWSKRGMPWLPGLLPVHVAARAVAVKSGTQAYSEPTVTVRRGREEDSGEVS
ncbi:hypothetical protein [Gordonia sputi]|uniref:hypothetical protein n=1 Tax=Gordonia sputi TaxID=36823 RepID=UPI0036A135E1